MLVQLNLNPDKRQLRQFGFIALGAFAVIGAAVLWRGGLFGLSFGEATLSVASLLWGLGIVSAAFSLLWPPANRPLFVALVVLTFPIGVVISHVMLAFLFFGILTPVALFFRLIGRDPLERAFDRERESYWTDLPEDPAKPANPEDPAKPANIDAKDYFRQF